MQLFDMINNDLVINLDSLNLPAFKDIWDRDKKKDKGRATREISYVYYLCDYRSPYADYKPRERETAVNRDFIKEAGWTPDKVVVDAIRTYVKHQETTLLRLLRAARKAANEVTDYFENVSFKELDATGKPVYDISDVLKALEKIGAVVKNLSTLESQVKKEQIESSNIRGGVDVGEYEDPRKIEGLEDIISM